MTLPSLWTKPKKGTTILRPPEAKNLGYDLDEGWSLKISEDEAKSFVSPDNIEFTNLKYNDLGELDNYEVITPEGKILSKFEYAELSAQPDITKPYEPDYGFQTVDDFYTSFKKLTGKDVESVTEAEIPTLLQSVISQGRNYDTDRVVRGIYPDKTEEQISSLFPQHVVPQVEPTTTGGIKSLGEFRFDYFKEKGYTDLPSYLGGTFNRAKYEGVSGGEAIIRQADIHLAEATKAYRQATGKTIIGVGAQTIGEMAQTGVDIAEVLGGSLARLPGNIGASVLQALQPSGASVVDRDWADKFISAVQAGNIKAANKVAEKYKNTWLPIKLTDLAQVSENIGYSLTSMGVGLAVGVPTALIPLPGARIAAYTLGTAASGAIAYNMTHYQITQQYLEFKDSEKRAKTGRGLTLAEENQLKKDFEGKAMAYGLWEAVPEAISNLGFVSILTAPLTKVAGSSIAVGIIKKLVGLYGEELLTETITQKGQSDIEVEAGLREGRINWIEAFKEIAKQTWLLTTIMAGAGQTIISSKVGIEKAIASLKTEIGESHPLYRTFEDKVKQGLTVVAEEFYKAGQKTGAIKETQFAEGKIIPEKGIQVPTPSLVKDWDKISTWDKGSLAERAGLPRKLASNTLAQFQVENPVELAKLQAQYAKEQAVPEKAVPQAGKEAMTPAQKDVILYADELKDLESERKVLVKQSEKVDKEFGVNSKESDTVDAQITEIQRKKKIAGINLLKAERARRAEQVSPTAPIQPVQGKPVTPEVTSENVLNVVKRELITGRNTGEFVYHGGTSGIKGNILKGDAVPELREAMRYAEPSVSRKAGSLYVIRKADWLAAEGKMGGVKPVLEIPIKNLRTTFPPLSEFASGWDNIPISDRVKLAGMAKLESKIGSKSWADITLKERLALFNALASREIEIIPAIPKAEITPPAVTPAQKVEQVTPEEIQWRFPTADDFYFWARKNNLSEQQSNQLWDKAKEAKKILQGKKPPQLVTPPTPVVETTAQAEVPPAPPTTEELETTKELEKIIANQEKFVAEYAESKGREPPPPLPTAPTVTSELPPDMPNAQEVANHISFEPDKVSLKERFLRGYHRAMSQWIDKLYPIDKFVALAKKLGIDISLEENPYIQARMLEGVTSKATSFIEDGTFGRKFWKMEKGKAVPNYKGVSLTSILEAVKDPQTWRDFSTYLTSLRAKELNNLGIETGITVDVANKAITELETKYPNFPELSEKIQKYQSDLLDYIQESGLISPELRKTLDTKYMSYVPFYRVLEELQGKGYMGKKMVDIASPIKRIKGSERDIINPLESIVKNTYAFISAADRNQIGVMMARLVNANPELQGMFEPIKTPMAKVANVTAKELGIDVTGLSDADAEGVFDIFRPSMFTKENVATVLIDGKKQFFKVDPDLNTALTAMDTANMGILWKILSTPAKWLRAGATLSPDFAIRNPLRDAMSAMIYSNHGFIPGVDFLRGVASIVRKDATYRLYKMSGAEHAMLVSLDRDYMGKTFKEVVEGKKFTDYVKHPLQLLQILSELGEKATRLGEFAKGIKQGVTPLAAGFDSREVTLDFAKAGTQAKAVNQIIAFFNSNIRGSDKMFSAFKEHPIRTSLKVLAFITLPSILLWTVNHDDPRWKEIPQWQKDLFWIVMTDKHIWRIPKPFELGILFGSAPERLLDYLSTKDPKMIREFASNLFESGMPGWLPTGIEPIIENITNHSFFRSIPVVSPSMVDLPPELQYTEYTSEIAKAMGKFLKYSPMKIDNIIQGWTGGLGRYATEAIDKVLRGTGVVASKIEPSATLADLPVVKAFVVRNPIGGSSESVSKFYDELDSYTALEKSLKGYIADKNSTEFEKLKAQHPELLFAYDNETDTYYSASARYLRQVTSELSDIRKLQDKVYKSTTMTPDQKRELIDSLDVIKTDLAKRALELLRNPSNEVGILEVTVNEIEGKLGVSTGSPLNEDVIKMTDIAPELAQAKGESPLKKLLEKNNKILADITTLPNTPLYQIDRAITKAGLTRRQNELLDRYDTAIDKKAFLEEYPELKENPKVKWLTDNPESNAILALWGNSKLLTQKAYDIAIGLIESGDIPNDALSERVLPPENLAKPYFELMVAKEKWGDSSWEVKLILAKNKGLVEWNPAWTLPDTPIASLEIKTQPKYRELYEKINNLSDRESPDYIPDEKKRAEAVKNLKTPAYIDDTRRIEAIEKGTDKVPTPDAIIKNHVDYGKIQDTEGIGSSSAESMLYRVDNPEYDKFRTDETIWEDNALQPIDESRIPIWRIDVKYTKEDEEYNAIQNDLPKEQARLRDEYMVSHEEYRKDNRRRDALDLTNPNTGVTFDRNQVENYVSYYELPTKGKRQERFLVENTDFTNAMVAMGKLANLPTKVPAVQYDDIYDKYADKFDLLDNYADRLSDDFIENEDARELARKTLRFTNDRYNEFGLAELKRDAYGLLLPENQIDNYVGYKVAVNEKGTYEDDWYLIDHIDLYQTLLSMGIFKERKDFTKVPTRKVYDKYLLYQNEASTKRRQDFRFNNPDLEAWLLLTKKVTVPITEQKRMEQETPTGKFQIEMERLRAEGEELHRIK